MENYWDQLSNKEKKQVKEQFPNITPDEFNKFIGSLESANRAEEGDRAIIEEDPPKPKPRPKKKGVKIKAGGLFTRKGPMQKKKK